METVITQLVRDLGQWYPDELKKRYKLENIGAKPLATIDMIGRRRGCLVAGGMVDLENTYKLILKE